MSGSSGGGSQQSNPQATPQQLADAYTSNLPAMLGVTNAQAGSTAQSLASAAAGANPIYSASGLQQLQQFAPGYQNAGNQLGTNQSQFTTGLLNGAGGQAANAANNLSNSLNPAQQASNTQAANLVNSINLNGLSGGEQAATERSLNQSNYATGNLGLDNATNAVSNAMNFGNALQAKRTALGTALGQAQGVASNQNSFVNPVGTALGSANTANNFGLGTFNPTQGTNAGAGALNFGSSIFGGQAQNASAQKSSGGSSNASGGISCFLTTACCEWKGLSDDCEELTTLRHFRDTVVPKALIAEYYKVAPTIVEKVRGQVIWMQYIWGVVEECVKMIKNGKNNEALVAYKQMVERLSKI